MPVARQSLQYRYTLKYYFYKLLYQNKGYRIRTFHPLINNELADQAKIPQLLRIKKPALRAGFAKQDKIWSPWQDNSRT